MLHYSSVAHPPSTPCSEPNASCTRWTRCLSATGLLPLRSLTGSLDVAWKTSWEQALLPGGIWETFCPSCAFSRHHLDKGKECTAGMP